jgi:hypothetical protein
MCSWDLLSWFANSLDLFQGRTALWDSILILCHKIKVGYGGIVRGMHLGASALSILPVMETESEDWEMYRQQTMILSPIFYMTASTNVVMTQAFQQWTFWRQIQQLKVDRIVLCRFKLSSNVWEVITMSPPAW